MKQFTLNCIPIFIGCLILSSCSSSKDSPVSIYKVSVVSIPSEGGYTDYQPRDFEKGESISILATPNEDYYFENWSGSVISSANPLPITVNSSMHLQANFKKHFTVNVSIRGDGEVIQKRQKSENGNHYEMVLTAVPIGTSKFLEWWGNDIHTEDNPITIPLNGNQSITAYFTPQWEYNIPKVLSFTVSPEEVDVTHASAVVTVRAHVTDDTGVDPSHLVGVWISMPNHPGLSGFFKRTSGTDTDGIYEVEFTIPQGFLKGRWWVHSSSFEDIFGNSSQQPLTPDWVYLTVK